MLATPLLAISDGEFCINVLTNKEIRKQLKAKNSGQVTRILKRLNVHGLIRNIRKTHRYHLTALAKQVIFAGFKFKNISLVLDLARF